MPRPKRRPPPAPAPQPTNDVELACQTLQAIKRQLQAITRMGGGEPSTDLLVGAVDDCADAVIVTDDAAEIHIVNSAAARMTGLSTRELQALTVWDLTASPSQVNFDMLWKEFLRAGRQRGTYSIRNRAGAAVEVAYCAEAHVLPGRHVSVLRRRQME